MLTSLGRYLRKMRIDRGELLKDMADRLGMSSAMLSSVENGKRNPTPDFASRVAEAYGLRAAEKNELLGLVAENSDSVSIGLRGMAPTDQRLAFSFARRFANLSEEDKARIKEVLIGSNCHE
ncbi:helix-turn-helix domain-containing protein [Thermophilibacter mediterraneus]|uniref:helix-turn-helix domain-containing protein n=1 Tax=Thermophilibacter mediterraneus TaxID=1871031 RepID=UPI00320B3EDA